MQVSVIRDFNFLDGLVEEYFGTESNLSEVKEMSSYFESAVKSFLFTGGEPPVLEKKHLVSSFFVIVSVALMNVNDLKGKCEVEIIPLVEKLVNEENLEPTIQAMGIIMFSTLTNEVRSRACLFVSLTVP
jgi:hypothetical protein